MAEISGEAENGSRKTIDVAGDSAESHSPVPESVPAPTQFVAQFSETEQAANIQLPSSASSSESGEPAPMPFTPPEDGVAGASFFVDPRRLSTSAVPGLEPSDEDSDDPMAEKNRSCGPRMVHSFKDQEEFALAHREGTIIEMANEEATYRRFNTRTESTHAWVINALPPPSSLIASDLETSWLVLVELPADQDKVFPAEESACDIGFKYDFTIGGHVFNPGMMKAERVPNVFDNGQDNGSIFNDYARHAAFNVTAPYMKDPVSRERYYPLAEIAVSQRFGALQFPPLTSANAVMVTIRVAARLVTHDTELKALSTLMQRERNLSALAQRARHTFDYMLDFRKPPTFYVDLFRELPHMDNPAGNPQTPAHLKSLYSGLNSDHKKVYEQFRHIPAGLALILGCPGAGKTALNAFIAAMALSAPIQEEVDSKTVTRPAKVLYLLDVNAPCDDAANRVHKTCKEAGIRASVIRVRGCAREMSRSVKLHPPAKGQNDVAGDVPDFTRGFLMQSEMSRVCNIGPASIDKAPSLDEAAWKAFDKKKSRYKQLAQALQKLEGDVVKTRRTSAELRRLVANLYFDVIRAADFIATTPVGASGQMGTLFKPDLVFVDEAAHARELTSLIPLAFTPARAYIFTGDTRQTRPFVQGASMSTKEAGQKMLKLNPYAKQLMISTMERADLAGALKSKLLITHRMYGNLHILVSELFYDGLLKSGMASIDRYPLPVLHLQSWLSQFMPGRHCVVPRVMIHCHSAREKTECRSFYNPAHESFIKQRCLELLSNPNFTRVDRSDQPGRILIITPYKAAFNRYKQFTSVLPPHLRGRLHAEETHNAMEARTVDSAQGHEADFVFVDTVRTKTAGFLNDPKRLCVMLSRARGGEMILMNEGMTTRMRSGVEVPAEWTSRVFEHCRGNGQLCYI
ncbi:nonsense-mediated mRNA decay protein 1 [Colletotrichum gloeosporioides Cg-14]|uniref:Nonsense-mediated mRNA decay protein 1 n=1 Tax=Colletotrichum gloeosporioides (strain Cg-14) TaxID=1237896 RepID=T0LNA4_COLGC|nr:nonsense-mediated mRNA decay protein 1 [Colletotrichum gloeosporioides Cg-14]